MQAKRGYVAGFGAVALVAVLMGVPVASPAQQGAPLTTLSMPAGQSLPVGLQHGLTAGKAPVGTAVEAYTTQRVPVAANQYLPAGATLTGVITASVHGAGGQPSSLGLQFTELHWHGQTIPVQVVVTAVANKAWVDGAGKPVLGASDRGSSSGASWTTEQVGGDALMRSGWSGQLVDGRGHKVGFSDFNGVYAFPAAAAHAGAAPEPSGLAVPRALGPFSADAKGPYGYGDDATLQQGPDGVVIAAPGKLEMRHGDALLLTVVGTGAAAAR